MFFITGLDPAGPGFIGNVVTNEFRLDPGDAAYVDVVHTDAGGIGTDEMVGHTAFFPNGGHDQPGCLHSKLQHMKLDIHVQRNEILYQTIFMRKRARALRGGTRLLNSCEIRDRGKLVEFYFKPTDIK